VKLTVVSKTGKEATIGVLAEGSFFGEGGLAGQTLHMGSATAMTDCTILRIDKSAMMQALHREHRFSDLFVAYLLARNHSLRRGFGRPAFQFQREEAGTNPAATGSFW